jgi:hypothetical protein
MFQITRRDLAKTPDLTKQAGSMSALTADKAYDQIDVYQAAIDRGSTDLKLLIHFSHALF